MYVKYDVNIYENTKNYEKNLSFLLNCKNIFGKMFISISNLKSLKDCL